MEVCVCAWTHKRSWVCKREKDNERARKKKRNNCNGSFYLLLFALSTCTGNISFTETDRNMLDVQDRLVGDCYLTVKKCL